MGRARGSSAYFSRLLAAVDPAAVGSRAALASLPVTRKSALMELQKAAPPFGGLNATPASEYDFGGNRCQGLAPGSSGSPVLSQRSGRLVGLVNTTTLGSAGLPDCSLNRPCELAAGQGRSLEATSYVTPATGLQACFDAGGRFALDGVGCPLDDGRQLRAATDWLGAANPERPPNPILPGPARERWDVRLSGALAYYRYKVGRADAVACRSLAGYGEARRVAETPVIDDPRPREEAGDSLCLIGGGSPRGGRAWERAERTF